MYRYISIISVLPYVNSVKFFGFFVDCKVKRFPSLFFAYLIFCIILIFSNLATFVFDIFCFVEFIVQFSQVYWIAHNLGIREPLLFFVSFFFALHIVNKLMDIFLFIILLLSIIRVFFVFFCYQ